MSRPFASPGPGAPARRRDPAPAWLAILLLGACLGALGGAPATWLPAAGAPLLALLLVLTLGWTLVVGAAGGPWRALGCLLAALPALGFAMRQGGGPEAPAPAPAVAALAVLSLAVACLAPRLRAGLAAALIGLLLADAVLGRAFAALLPADLNALAHPLAEPPRPPPNRAAPAGLRPGGPVLIPPGVAHPLTHGPGPWWEAAGSGSHPGPRPVVLPLAAPEGLAEVARAAPTTVLPEALLDPAHALDLDAVDLVWVGPRAWDPADPRAEARSRALLGWVRRGGLLVGPGPEEEWPARLGLALGAAAAPGRGGEAVTPGRGGEAVAVPRPLGLGRVLRPAAPSEVAALLEARGWVRPVATLLDGAAVAPPPLPGQPRWEPPAPGARGPVGWILGIFAFALGGFLWMVPSRAAPGVTAALAAGALALLTSLPAPPMARLAAVVLEVGGEGGRRVDALLIAAGPGGFERALSFEDGGVVRLLGGRLTATGTVYVAPGQSAWLVRERPVPGPDPADHEARDSAWLRPLLVGAADPQRMRFGRWPGFALRVDGRREAFVAQTLRYRPPEPRRPP